MNVTFQNVQGICAKIDMSVDSPVIDLSNVTWIEQYAIVYLGMFLRHHNSSGKYFLVNMPAPGVQDYLAGQKFWERFNFSADVVDNIKGKRRQTNLGDIIDLTPAPFLAEDVAEQIRELLVRTDVRLPVEDVAEAVAELVDNFVQHALQPYGVITAQYYPTRHQFRVALADCGVGIRESLSRSNKYPETADMAHSAAIVKAFEPLVTCKAEGGMGFDYVRDIVTQFKGTLFLSSFDGSVYLDGSGTLYVLPPSPYPLPGVHIELTFDT